MRWAVLALLMSSNAHASTYQEQVDRFACKSVAECAAAQKEMDEHSEKLAVERVKRECDAWRLVREAVAAVKEAWDAYALP